MENNTAVSTAKSQPSAKALAVSNFQKVMNNSYYQGLLENTLKENRGSFCTSLMELFSSDDKLRECKPVDLMAEAIKAASLHLPLNKQLGQCYILPFKNHGVMTPTLVVGTRGFLQLAMRTNKYETINADVVYEGELKSYDKVTGNLDLSGQRTSNVPVGYFAYFKMKGGLSKLLYMSLDDVCTYAKQYSPTVKFSAKTTAETLKAMALEQAAKGSSEGVGWYSNFESMALKGLALDTKIPTPEGFTTMGELKVGDTVYNALGEETKVIAKSEVKNLPCYKITTQNGQEIVCDSEHRWFVKGGKGKPSEWVVMNVADMYNVRKLGYPVVIPNTAVVQMRAQELPVNPYVLGYWLGNGSSSSASVCCSNEDVDEIESYLSPYYNTSKREDVRSNAVTINLSSKGVRSADLSLKCQLRSLGVLDNKITPDIYKRASVEDRIELIRGLCDSDGCIENQRGRVSYTSCREGLAKDLYEVVSSLGERASLRRSMSFGFGKHVEVFTVQWQPRTFNPFKLKRKAERVHERMVIPNNSIKSIEIVDSVPTQCIAVDSMGIEDDASLKKSFLITEGFIPTHNTVLRRLLSKWGELSIESGNILEMDEAPVTATQQRDEEFAEAKEVISVDAQTGEVIQPTQQVAAPAPEPEEMQTLKLN